MGEYGVGFANDEIGLSEQPDGMRVKRKLKTQGRRNVRKRAKKLRYGGNAENVKRL